jgi:hypothetical protein
MFSIWLLMEHYGLSNNGSPFTSPCSTFWSFIFPCTWLKGSSLLVSRLLCLHWSITKFWFTSHTWSVQNLTMIRIYETWSRCCGIALQGFAGRFDHYISTLKSDKVCNYPSLYIAGKTCLKFFCCFKNGSILCLLQGHIRSPDVKYYQCTIHQRDCTENFPKMLWKHWWLCQSQQWRQIWPDLTSKDLNHMGPKCSVLHKSTFIRITT